MDQEIRVSFAFDPKSAVNSILSKLCDLSLVEYASSDLQNYVLIVFSDSFKAKIMVLFSDYTYYEYFQNGVSWIRITRSLESVLIILEEEYSVVLVDSGSGKRLL